jgi:hypothetical protein
MRRRLLKIEARKGRPHHLSEAQEHALWRRWCQLREQEGTDDQLDAMLMLAEEQQISLTVVWQQIALHSLRK